MPRKSFRGHASVKDVAQGIAEVVVSAYGNVDHEGDVVVKGASAKQIAREYGPNPKGMLDHNYSMLNAVAKTLDWWEEDDGLHIKTQYNLEKQVGREAFSDLSFYGDDMEFSVTYGVKGTVPPTKAQKDAGVRRVITEWQIDEWSGVWLGMNSDTRLVSAKGKGAETKALVGSYEDLAQRIADALRDVVEGEYVYVRATWPDRVVYGVETYDGDTFKYETLEVTYTETADGFEFGEPAEVRIAEVAVPEPSEPPKAAAPNLEVKGERPPFDWRAARLHHLVASTKQSAGLPGPRVAPPEAAPAAEVTEAATVAVSLAQEGSPHV